MKHGLLTLLAVVLLSASGWADAESGLDMLRQARRQVRAGQFDDALQSLQDARVEWPGSPLVAHAKADLHAAQQQWDAALSEYARGARDGYEFRAAFNSGVVRHDQSEQALGAAGVPLDPAALPAGPQPELLAAIEEALPRQRAARLDFLRALAERPDAAARESVAALNRRLDDLREMQAELLERQQDQDQGEDGDEGDEGEDQQESDDEQQDEDDQQGDQDQQQDGEDQQDQPQDEQQQEGQDEQQPPPESQQTDEVMPAQLTPQQVAELMDKLEELEAVAMELQRRQRESARRGVEKDW